MSTAEKPQPSAEPAMRSAVMVVGVVGLALSVMSATWFTPKVGLSVLVGATVATANLWALGRIVLAFMVAPPESTTAKSVEPARDLSDGTAALVEPVAEAAADESAPKGKVAAWSTLALLKMLILFGGAWQLMKHGVVSPLGLVLGYASLPIGITLAQMLGRLRP